MALLLSHGQASVDRGFSVNNESVVENQQEESLIARRIIKDHIMHVNCVTNFEITRLVIWYLLLAVQGLSIRNT